MCRCQKILKEQMLILVINHLQISNLHRETLTHINDEFHIIYLG